MRDQVKVLIVIWTASGFKGHYLMLGLDVMTPTSEGYMQACVSHLVCQVGGMAVATWQSSGPSVLVVLLHVGVLGEITLTLSHVPCACSVRVMVHM